MFAEVTILAQEKTNTLLVPRSAVVQDTEPYVYVVNGDIVERQPVTTGLFDTDRVEILSGLKEGDLVITAGQPNLTGGAEVAITNDPRLDE
jgi:multidrug efflux pump subunit AcrA (membrane-fusion protein)